MITLQLSDYETMLNFIAWALLLYAATNYPVSQTPSRDKAVVLDSSMEVDPTRWEHNGTQPATYNSFAGNNFLGATWRDPQVLELRRALAF